MNRRALVLVLGVSLVLLVARDGRAAMGQGEAARLQVGTTKGVPGTRASVGMLLFLPESGAKSKHVSSSICFDDSFLQFADVKRGPAGEVGGATIAKEVERRDAETCVNLELSFADTVTSGTLAELAFDLDKTAPVDLVITLRTTGRVEFAGGTGETVTEDGSVKVVETAPFFGCFFYMH